MPRRLQRRRQPGVQVSLVLQVQLAPEQTSPAPVDRRSQTGQDRPSWRRAAAQEMTRYDAVTMDTLRHRAGYVSCSLFHCLSVSLLTTPPFPQIDNIGAMMIVWRVRGKIIRSVLCNIVCNNVHSAMHTHMNRPNSSLDWGLSHLWAHFTVRRFIFCVYYFVYIACKCTVQYCNMVRWTWWD